jgi:O-antigen/teichoic acid export membrane protein
MKLLKNSIITTVSTVVANGLPFFLQPFLTRVLSAEEYGFIFIFQLIAVVLVPITHLSYNICLEKSYFEFNSLKLSILRSTAITTSIVLGLVWFSIIFILINWFNIDFTIPPKIVYLACLFSLLEAFFTYLISHFKITEKFKKLAAFQFLIVVIDFSLTLFFIMILNIGWEGRVYAKLIAWGILGLYFLIYFYKKKLFKLQISQNSVKYLNRFSLPLVPHVLNTVIIAVSDRFFLSWMEGPKQLGLYSVGYQWGLIITTLGIAFNKVWTPFAYKNLKENNIASKSKFVKYFYMFFGFIIIVAACLALSSNFLIRFLLGKDFHDSSVFVNYTSFAYAFNSIFLLLTPIFYVNSLNRLLLYMSVSIALLNILLNYILILKNGAIGAAQATLISFTLKLLITWVLSTKIVEMPWYIFNQNTSKRN